MRLRNQHGNLALFCGQLALGLMQTTFMFYYVKVFLNVFHVNEYWFNVAQVLFMVWNAVNDPLFGYIQDVSGTWMKDRGAVFTYVGPLMAGSFLILWFPWRSSSSSPPYVEGLHLIVALFLYDAFYSCVGVAWGALFTESTRDHRRRVNALKYSQLSVLLSVNVIVIAEKTSHSLDNFPAFQVLCVVVSILSVGCFYLTGRMSATKTSEEKLLQDDSAETAASGSRISRIISLTRELLTSKDFQRIVVINFIHSARSVAHLNFASIATDLLIPQRVLAKGSWQLSLFFAVCTLVPQILVITNENLLVRSGVYRVMMFSFAVSVLSSGLYVLSWSPYVVMFFMVIDSITVHSTAPLFNILLAEFIEDDLSRNDRRNALSSLIFSLNAFIIKPATSVAPVVIVYFLNRHGYELYQKEGLRTEDLSRCMLRIIFATPCVLAALQCFAFRRYSLRNKHLVPALPV
ncbi:Protein F28B3.5 a [Aphelenchoides avenae]|nr:Protein F28B3.5 a [Aphelenchus avenae]